MVNTIVAEEVGPRPLLAYLLLHHGADAATLTSALRRDSTQVSRSLTRLARRGLLTTANGRYEIVSDHRAAVAAYVEGALALRDLSL